MTIARLLLSATALTIAASASQAADLPSRSSPYIPPQSYAAPVPNWQGPYVGANVGGGFGKVGPSNTSGVVGGVYGGYNAQFGQVVVGGEGDISASNVHNKTYDSAARQNWTGTVRARAGYAFGNVLAYGTAGVAFGENSARNQYGKTNNTDVGYVLGAGGEMMVTPNVALRGEYLYYNFGSTDYPADHGTAKADTHTNVFRAGAAYKF